MVHSRIRVGHPQSNGKMERFHKTLKSECVRTHALSGLEEAQRVIEAYVHEYNHERLHSALNYLTPSDYLEGEDHIYHRLEERKAILEQGRQDRRKKQNQIRQATRSA